MTVLLPNPERRYPLACGPDPGTLGLRVPDLPAFAGVTPPGAPVLGQPGRRAGRAHARRGPAAIRDGAQLVIDGGALGGTPSTVIDLRRYEEHGEWTILRHGAVAEEPLRRLMT